MFWLSVAGALFVYVCFRLFVWTESRNPVMAGIARRNHSKTEMADANFGVETFQWLAVFWFLLDILVGYAPRRGSIETVVCLFIAGRLWRRWMDGSGVEATNGKSSPAAQDGSGAKT
jgi:hypothetical protein